MKRPVWFKTPRWLSRLGSSLLIGGQAVSAVAKGRIGFNDLMQELMEAGPGSFLIVLITALAAGTVFNIQVAAELSKQGASATVGVEFCGTSISSRSSGNKHTEQRLTDNPHFVFADAEKKGYGVVEFTPGQLTTTLRVVDDVTRADAKVETLASFTVQAGRSQVERT